MASLHEGVFFDRSHAEAYISIFQTQLDDFETADAYEAGEGNYVHMFMEYWRINIIC